MNHAHWYCGSGIRMGTVETAGLCSMISEASGGTQRLGAGMICKLLRSCLVFGGGCRLRALAALHMDLSMWVSSCFLTARYLSAEDGCPEGGNRCDRTLFMTWPWKSCSITSATSIGESSLPGITQRKHRPQLYRPQLSEGGCQSQFKCIWDWGVGVVLVWSPCEMQSATVCICGEWSQQSYQKEAFTFFIL